MREERVVRHYVEPVEVRRGRVGDVEGPAQFLWRDRLYLVRDVLGFWVESTTWWRDGGQGAGEREVWRVEAGRGRHQHRLVADLALDPTEGRWVLLRTHD
jgi:hypothetical protein